jgi:hypothetical protein
MTPFGGLVPWAAYQKKSGIIDLLSKNCPVKRTSPNASSVYDVICSFVLTALCDGRRFSHVNRLREDPSIKELFGMDDGVVGDDTIRRFFYSVDDKIGREWIAKSSLRLWRSLPENFILDWDSTVQTKYGSQEGAEVGYNPHKQGRKSYHPLLAAVGDTRLCLYYRWRPGNAATSGQWIEAMEECLEWLGPFGRRLWLNRGDIGFSNDRIMLWHEEKEERPNYLFKLKITRNIRRALAGIGEDEWTGKSSGGLLQVAEKEVQLEGWDRPRRVIFGRRLLGVIPSVENNSFWDEAKYEFEVYVTDLDRKTSDAWQVIELYRKRGDCENLFDELKNHWGFSGFCCRKSGPTELAASILLLTYNMWNLFLRLMKPERHVEAFQGRRWFLLIAARLVKTGRRKELHVAVQGQWWQELKEGYQRVCQWLEITAPQLENEDLLQPMLL